MRPVELFLVLIVATVASACGGAAPGPATQSPAVTPPSVATLQPTTTQPPTSTTPLATTPAATTPPASTPAPGGNTITYEITGEYEASGEAVFDEEGSNYTEEGELGIFREGWTAYFENEAAGHTIRLVTRPDDFAIEVFLGEEVVRAEPNSDCTYNITKNDATGPAGSGVCPSARLYPSQDTRVNLSFEWEVNL